MAYYDHITTDQAQKTHLYTERCAATGLFLIFLTQVAATVRNRVTSNARKVICEWTASIASKIHDVAECIVNEVVTMLTTL